MPTLEVVAACWWPDIAAHTEPHQCEMLQGAHLLPQEVSGQMSGSVYLYCCSTLGTVAWHCRHSKVPRYSSGRTSDVRVTVPSHSTCMSHAADAQCARRSLTSRCSGVSVAISPQWPRAGTTCVITEITTCCACRAIRARRPWPVLVRACGDGLWRSQPS